MLFIRLCSALLSACIFILYMPNPAFFLWRLSSLCIDSWDESCAGDFAWYSSLATFFNVLAGCLWVSAWAFLELMKRRGSERQKPRLLTHLRYGPIAVLVFSVATIFISDMMLIQYSRWQIVRYIYSDAAPKVEPSLKLHNNYRHWCGNGMAANRYALYGATPAAYFDDPDPGVRARALQASISVYDWINHPGDGPSVDVLRKAVNDPDPLVREIASECQSELRQIRRLDE